MTTATDFSQPMYVDDQPAGGHDETNFEVVDLNDPNLLMAELDSNVDKNAYDAPPPLPDGFYRAKAKQLFKDVQGTPRAYQVKKDKQGQPYAFTAIELQVQEPGGQFDGQRVTDNFVSTMVARNGGIPVVRILQILGVKIPAKVTAAWLMDSLEKALAGEPDLVVETAWEASLDQAEQDEFKAKGAKQPRVIGMHKFPDSKTTPGTKSPDITVESSALGTPRKFNLRARPRVMGYHTKDHPTSKK